jgi:hypothetical protein
MQLIDRVVEHFEQKGLDKPVMPHYFESPPATST